MADNNKTVPPTRPAGTMTLPQDRTLPQDTPRVERATGTLPAETPNVDNTALAGGGITRSGAILGEPDDARPSALAERTDRAASASRNTQGGEVAMDLANEQVVREAARETAAVGRTLAGDTVLSPDQLDQAALKAAPRGGDPANFANMTDEQRERVRLAVEEERAKMRDLSAGHGTVQGRPEDLLARAYPNSKGTVKMFFKRPVRLTLKTHGVVQFAEGVYDVPAELKDDWWLRANGVTVV